MYSVYSVVQPVLLDVGVFVILLYMKPRSSSFEALRPHYPLICFLFFYFGFILLTYRDYGVAWDEYDVYSRGGALFHFLLGKGWDPSYFLVNDGKADGWVLYDYWYPLLLFILNPAFSLEHFHWLNLCFASLVFISSYELLYSYYRNPFLALQGPLFLFLMPRFLGHLPFTPRDTAFAVTYFCALSALYFLSAKTGWAKIVVLGLLFGMAQASRMVGLSLYVIWILFYLYEWQQDKAVWWHKPASRKKHFRFAVDFILTLAVSLLFMVATWPYLAHGFFSRFLEILGAASRFPWTGQFLFNGQMVSATDLPWTYLPIWLLVSTPLFILFFLAAIPFVVKKLPQNRPLVFFALALGINLLLVFLLKPVVYLGMRHFLYLLPLLAILAAMSASEFLLNVGKDTTYPPPRRQDAKESWIVKHKAKHNVSMVLGFWINVFQNIKSFLASWRLGGKRFGLTTFWGIALLVLANMVVVAGHMARLHPYEYVYFNEFTGGLPGAYGKYEIEDRGTSAKEAVEWLKANRFTDPNKTYHVASYQDPFSTVYYLPLNVKYEQDPAKADYLITLPFNGKHQLQNNLLYSVTREGVPLIDIYEKSRQSTVGSPQ